MRVIILAILSTWIFLSCGSDEKLVVFDRDEAIRLLSLDSNKTWTRTVWQSNGVEIEASVCEINQLLTFYESPDSLYFELKSDPSICDNDNYFTNGYWDVAEDPAIRGRINRIMFVINSDTLFKNIDEITSIFLGTSYTENDDFVQERFQKKN